MEDKDKIPILLEFLFGEAAETAQRGWLANGTAKLTFQKIA